MEKIPQADKGKAREKAALAVDVEAYAAEAAKQRQGTRSDIVEKIPQSEKGKAREKAAQKVGRVSAPTYFRKIFRKLRRVRLSIRLLRTTTQLRKKFRNRTKARRR